MYAIIEDSGTQIKVVPGDILEIDLRDAAQGSAITFDRVLLVGGDESDGQTAPARIGTPYVEGATVSAEVLGKVIGPKLRTVKYARRKGYKVKKGHRQGYLRVKIGAIAG